jgi:bacterioferritin
MQGNTKIIDAMNVILRSELAAISQYMVHSEMCDNWGYADLAELFEKRARDEMKHAEKLIARIIFLEGVPVVNLLDPINIGTDVEDMHLNDHKAELSAIAAYNNAIELAIEIKDNGSRELFDTNLAEEEGHIDTIESHLTQIEQVGFKGYLMEQI